MSVSWYKSIESGLLVNVLVKKAKWKFQDEGFVGKVRFASN
jgi:hypothetical protein